MVEGESNSKQVSLFKHVVSVEIILVCLRWKCEYEITYRDLADLNVCR
jgi:hypothetical protein